MKTYSTLILLIVSITLMSLNGCGSGPSFLDSTGILAVEPGNCSGVNRDIKYTITNTSSSKTIYSPYLIVNGYNSSKELVFKNMVKLPFLEIGGSRSVKGVLPCSIKQLAIVGYNGDGNFGVTYQPVIYGINNAVYSIN